MANSIKTTYSCYGRASIRGTPLCRKFKTVNMKTLIQNSVIFFLLIFFFYFQIADAQIQQNNIRVVDTIYTPPGFPDGPLPGLLYLPSVTNGAAVIVVHGLAGKMEYYHKWGEDLAALGYVVMSIEYHSFENVFGVPNHYPAPVREIKTAAEFLRKNSITFGCYAGKVAVIAGSGGAMHTAQTIIWDNDDAYFGTDPSINDHFDAAVLYYGWYDYYNHLESIFNTPGTHDTFEALLAELFYNDPSLQATKGNPLVNVNNITTPILMFHGTADRILELAQSEVFRDSLVAHGKNVRLEIVPGADHVYEFQNSQPLGHFNFNLWSDLGLITRDTIIAYLSRTLGVNNIHCPYNKSYWKNHSSLWNSDALPMKLGTNYYNKQQLLSILNSPAGNDPSKKLAQELIAAKLNLANNSWAAPIASTIVAADNLIGNRSIPIIPAIISNSSEGQQMTSLGNLLNAYNNGTLTPNCNNGGNRVAQGNSANNYSLNIFPNPATNSITIKFPYAEEAEVSITNLFEQKLFSEKINSTSTQIDVSRFPAGMYVVKCSSGENFETKIFSIIK